MNRLFAFTSVLALSAGIAAANPYEPYSGTTLVVNFPAHPHYDAVMKVLPDFTALTGIEVEVDQLEYLKMREKQTLELTKDEGDYDLIAYVVFSKADYVFADQLENLAKYFMNPKLADPAWNAGDLIDGRRRGRRTPGRRPPGEAGFCACGGGLRHCVRAATRHRGQHAGAARLREDQAGGGA